MWRNLVHRISALVDKWRIQLMEMPVWDPVLPALLRWNSEENEWLIGFGTRIHNSSILVSLVGGPTKYKGGVNLTSNGKPKTKLPKFEFKNMRKASFQKFPIYLLPSGTFFTCLPYSSCCHWNVERRTTLAAKTLWGCNAAGLVCNCVLSDGGTGICAGAGMDCHCSVQRISINQTKFWRNTRMPKSSRNFFLQSPWMESLSLQNFIYIFPSEAYRINLSDSRKICKLSCIKISWQTLSSPLEQDSSKTAWPSLHAGWSEVCFCKIPQWSRSVQTLVDYERFNPGNSPKLMVKCRH